MSHDAPLISKALRLVSFAIIVSIVAIGVSAGYSGFQEYNALTSLAGSQNSSPVHYVMKGSSIEISGLNIPNKMVYPVNLDLLGTVSIQNSSVASFNSGQETLSPGQTKPVNLTVDLDYAKALSTPDILRHVLLNSSILEINTTIYVEIVPLLGINLSSNTNSTLGPVLGDLKADLESTQAALSSDGKFVIVPLVMTWINTTPISFSGNMSFVLTSMPGHSLGRYGSATGPLLLTEGANTAHYNLEIPSSDLGASFVPGEYSFNVTISTGGVSTSFPMTTRV